MRKLIFGLLVACMACATQVPAGYLDSDEQSAVVEFDDGPLTICAHILEDHELVFSELTWGVKFSCENPDLYVLVSDLGKTDDGHDIAGSFGESEITIATVSFEKVHTMIDMVLAHEIGHALGNGHVKDICDIMFHSTDWDEDCIRSQVER